MELDLEELEDTSVSFPRNVAEAHDRVASDGLNRLAQGDSASWATWDFEHRFVGAESYFQKGAETDWYYAVGGNSQVMIPNAW